MIIKINLFSVIRIFNAIWNVTQIHVVQYSWFYKIQWYMYAELLMHNGMVCMPTALYIVIQLYAFWFLNSWSYLSIPNGLYFYWLIRELICIFIIKPVWVLAKYVIWLVTNYRNEINQLGIGPFITPFKITKKFMYQKKTALYDNVI